MFGLSGSETLLVVGIAVMVFAVVAALICVIVFILTGKNLKEQLEREYGNPWE